MPPTAGKVKSALRKNRRAASDESDGGERAIRDSVRAAIISGFHKTQQTTSAHNAQRKVLSKHLEEHRNIALPLICAVCVKSLSMHQAPDVIKRHCNFVADLCKTLAAERNDDSVAAAIMQAVVPYHTAKDKAARFAVCSLMEPLLRTLRADVDTDERNELYDSIVEAMKTRSLDSFHAVRERAIAALAVFQEGKKDCDATQHILVAACEDPNPAVRRQAAFVAVPKEAYFGAVSRMTRDVATVVRKAAWDSLAKYKYTHAVAFCQLNKLSFIELVYSGFKDTAVPVQLSATHAVQKWLARDMQNDPVAFLSKIALPPTESPAVALLARTLHDACLKHRATSAAEKAPVIFRLETEGLTPANVIMWRVCCEAAVSAGDASEGSVLPPLLDFSAVLRDAIDTFIQQDRAQCRVAKFVNPDHADHILRILLCMFPVYEEGGYLTHTDDQTRAALIKNLSSLLKVVTDSDPGLYAEDTMRALRLIAARHAAQVDTTVHDVLQLLFRSLTLPRLHELGFDDVEMFGRKDLERRQELDALRQQQRQESRRSAAALPANIAARLEALQESIETDTLYLTRMMHVVNQYLTFCSRGDAVPPYCAHFIQLGRTQCDLSVRALATKALGLQCLLAPTMVHTFLPLILADATAVDDGVSRLQHTPVSEAALCVLFDLLTEYPPAFFSQGEGLTYTDAREADARAREGVVDEAERGAHRDAVVSAIANEDMAKVATGRLLRAAKDALLGHDATLRRIAMRGFCKLLACGRLTPQQSEEILAIVMVALFTFEVAAQSRGPHPDVVGAYLYRQLDFFITSFASSDPRRQRTVADAGILALRMIVTRMAQLTPPLPAQRLLSRLVLYTDAAILKAARDVDPDFTRSAFEQHQQAAAAAAAEVGGDAVPATGVDGDEPTALNTSGKATAGSRSSVGGVGDARGTPRLWRVLSANSLHEYVAQQLLLIVTHHKDNIGAQKAAVAALPALRMYARDSRRSKELDDYTASALAAAADTSVSDAIAAFAEGLNDIRGRVATNDGGEASDEEDAARRSSGNLSSASALALTREAAKKQTDAESLLEAIGPHLIAFGAGNRPSGRLSGRPSSTGDRSAKTHRHEGRATAASEPEETPADTPSEDLMRMLPPRSRAGARR
jgi:hypothetical protein